MQSIFVFLDIKKVADLRWKNVDASRIQVVCQMIWFIYFCRSSLGKVCAKFHHYRICVTDFREGTFLPASVSNPEKADPE